MLVVSGRQPSRLCSLFAFVALERGSFFQRCACSWRRNFNSEATLKKNSGISKERGPVRSVLYFVKARGFEVASKLKLCLRKHAHRWFPLPPPLGRYILSRRRLRPLISRPEQDLSCVKKPNRRAPFWGSFPSMSLPFAAKCVICLMYQDRMSQKRVLRSFPYCFIQNSSDVW